MIASHVSGMMIPIVCAGILYRYCRLVKVSPKIGIGSIIPHDYMRSQSEH